MGVYDVWYGWADTMSPEDLRVVLHLMSGDPGFQATHLGEVATDFSLVEQFDRNRRKHVSLGDYVHSHAWHYNGIMLILRNCTFDDIYLDLDLPDGVQWISLEYDLYDTLEVDPYGDEYTDIEREVSTDTFHSITIIYRMCQTDDLLTWEDISERRWLNRITYPDGIHMNEFPCKIIDNFPDFFVDCFVMGHNSKND